MQRSAAHCTSTVNLNSLSNNSAPSLEPSLQKLHCMRQQMADTVQSLGHEYSPKPPTTAPSTALQQLPIISNDLEHLWGIVMESVGGQRSELFELKSYSRVNEEYLLYSYKTMVALTEAISNFSKIINQGNYPLELYKGFRRMYEMVSTMATTMHKYRSLNCDFNQAKEGYINDQVGLFEQVQVDPYPRSTMTTEDSNQKQFKQNFERKHVSTKGTSPQDYQRSEDTEQRPDQRQQLEEISQLKMEIQRLQDILQQNNEDFAVEIQKYNRILYEQQDELKLCEHKFMHMEGRLEELQSMNVRLREEKIRDDLLIEYILKIFRNMSRKLRHYEKEAGYLSPGRSRVEQRNPTPKSRLVQQHPSRIAYPRLRTDFPHSYLD